MKPKRAVYEKLESSKLSIPFTNIKISEVALLLAIGRSALKKKGAGD